MNHRVGTIRNLRTIKSLRGDPLTIDLGINIDGDLRAWMKKDPNDSSYREFEILENRYLVLSKDKTSDYYFENTLIEEISGKWYFDVELLSEGDAESKRKTIYTGTILFINDITGSNGVEAMPYEELFNVEGGSSNSIYLNSQAIDLGNSNI